MANIVRVHQGIEIPHRPGDRYIDASAMCRAYGKRWGHYCENAGTRAFFEALARRTGAPVKLTGNPASLIQATEGRGGGVFVHPRIALHLAQWLDAEFAVQVSEWMEELLTTGRVELVPAPRPWSTRLDQMVLDFRHEVITRHPGWWAVATELMADLLLLEDELFRHGLPLNIADLPDGSVGQHWAKFRSGRMWAIDCRKDCELRTPHRTLSGKPVSVFPGVYPREELPRFLDWFQGTYAPEHLPAYLARKFKKLKEPLAVASAADRGCRRIARRQAQLDLPLRRQLTLAGGIIKVGDRAQIEAPGQQSLFAHPEE